jgi:hypothetical protein
MKKLILFLIFSSLFLTNTFSKQNNSSSIFLYTSPVHNSKYINKHTSIIITFKEKVSEQSLKKSDAILIYGSIKGRYDFKVNCTDEKNKYILEPKSQFFPGEKITVTFSPEIKFNIGNKIKKEILEFEISRYEINNNELPGLKNELTDEQYFKILNSEQNDIPAAFPEITVLYSNNPAPGKILLSNLVYNIQIPNTPYLIIINNDAAPVFTRQTAGQVFNFDRQPNGNFTYFSRYKNKYLELDTAYNLIDSFYTGNGYVTDLHELRVLTNGHALLMSYDKQFVDMSQYVPNGNPNALVTGLIIQEIDENKNVVFQWRSWDHIPITDAMHENLTAPSIDYVHGNAIEIDNDGNLMISSRHLDEITKINRTTGEIIWRWGGKKNQFTFINDPIGFCYQHGIRRLPNGNVILYDNGNYHTPQVSRAVEYALNEVNLTATKVWEYYNEPNIFGSSMGFAQRLENGNTLISWGSTNPTLTEVKPDGSKALEITLPNQVYTYRAFKYNWGNSITHIGLENSYPKKFELYQNYPNPFNPTTTIKFSVPLRNNNEENITLKVYDILGKELSVLIDKPIDAGNYEVKWDGSSYSSGIYYYVLSAGNYRETKKMVLVK